MHIAHKFTPHGKRRFTDEINETVLGCTRPYVQGMGPHLRYAAQISQQSYVLPLPSSSSQRLILAMTGSVRYSDYRKVLLNSTFTLSPMGHNLECYRWFEAAEAGSIPIILQSEVDLTTSRGLPPPLPDNQGPQRT